MANEIKLKELPVANFTITLASLATGSARASLAVNNSVTKYPKARVHLKIMSGTAPTAGSIYEVFLLRYDGVIGTDGWIGTDSAITIENAYLNQLGTIVVTATLNKVFFGEFDTEKLGALGDTWGIAIQNLTGQALNATEGNHIKNFRYQVPEIQ